MILSKITGLGKQTIEALKYSVKSLQTSVAGHTSWISQFVLQEKDWHKVVVTAANAPGSLIATLPGNAVEIIGYCSTAQSDASISGSVRSGVSGDTFVVGVSNIIHASHPQKCMFWMIRVATGSNNVTYRVGHTSGTDDTSSTLYESVEPVVLGSITKVGLRLNSGSFANGDTLTIYYKAV